MNSHPSSTNDDPAPRGFSRANSFLTDLSISTQASEVTEVIHMDYMHIGEPPESAGHRFTRVLVLVDVFSWFVQLIPCNTADCTELARG